VGGRRTAHLKEARRRRKRAALRARRRPDVVADLRRRLGRAPFTSEELTALYERAPTGCSKSAPWRGARGSVRRGMAEAARLCGADVCVIEPRLATNLFAKPRFEKISRRFGIGIRACGNVWMAV